MKDKYSGVYHHDTLLRLVACELAEANRLKRLEMSKEMEEVFVSADGVNGVRHKLEPKYKKEELEE